MQELLEQVRLGGDVRTLAQLQRRLLRRRPIAPGAGDQQALVPGDRQPLGRRAPRRPRRAASRCRRRAAPRAPRRRRCRTPCGSSSPRARASRRSPRRRAPRSARPPCRSRATSGPANARAASSVSGVSPSWLTRTSRSASGGSSDELERVDAVAGRLRRVEGGPAADGDDPALRQPPVGRHLRQPLRLRRDRRPHLLARHGCPLYHGRVGVFERFELAKRPARPDGADAARPVGLVLRHARGRLALRDGRDERDRALRRAHVLQGHRAAADRARHRRRDRLRSAASSTPSPARSTRATTSAAPPRRATSRSTSSSTCSATPASTPEEIEREKGVIIEEMNMYFDTPRDFIGGVYESLLYGDQPLGWDIIGRKETVRERDARDVPRLHEHLVPAEPDGRRRRRPDRRRACTSGSRSCSATCPTARDRLAGRRGSPRTNGRVKVHTKASDQAHLVLGVRSRPLDRPRPLRPPAARDRARRRHVVAPLHRGARAPRPRLLRLRHEPLLHGRGVALRAVRRRHQPDRRGGDDDRRAVQAARRRSRCRPTSSRRRATSRRAASCSSSRARTGRSCSASGARCSRAGRRSRRRCSTRSTPSPPRTSSASRRTSSTRGRTSSVIGPFDDAERFEKLLG